MALSEQTITELSDAANAGELVGHEKLFPVIQKVFTEKGYNILDGKGREELLENFKKSELPKLVGEETKNIHGYYDKDLKEVFGEDSDLIKPREGESKTYHVNKRLLKELYKEKKELEEKLAKGDHKEFYENKIQETEQKAQRLIEEEQKKYKELEGQLSGFQKENKFNEVFTPIYSKIDPSNLEDEMFKEAQKSIKEHVLKSSKVEDGTLVMTNQDGSIMKDESFKPVTVAAYLESKFKSKFKKEDNGGGGTGGDGGGGTDPSKVTVDNFNPQGAKTKSELIDAIRKAGIPQYDPRYAEIYATFTRKLQIKS